ncbi:MAG: hypothetical protein IPG50_13480 [Myxococcales bacterium]|nr:hypothetical protein [Myxococcales bacterium]
MELSEKYLLQRLREGLTVPTVLVREQAPTTELRPRTFSDYLKLRRELQLSGV